jgi:hypothetical protein
MSNEFFKEKYLKYKEMYLRLKQYGAGIKWQYEEKNGIWKDYNDEQNIEIEKGYQTKIPDKYASYTPDIKLIINSNEYTIEYLSDRDFPGDPPHAYQKINGTKRPMRRIDTDNEVTRPTTSGESTYRPTTSGPYISGPSTTGLSAYGSSITSILRRIDPNTIWSVELEDSTNLSNPLIYRHNSSSKVLDEEYIKQLEINYLSGKRQFSYGNYRVEFIDSIWWNKPFDAIQTDIRSGKQKPLRRGKM